jgi:hypothetical protein
MKFSTRQLLIPSLFLGAGFILFMSNKSLNASSDSTQISSPSTSSMVLCPTVYLNGTKVGTTSTAIPVSTPGAPGNCYFVETPYNTNVRLTFSDPNINSQIIGATGSPPSISTGYAACNPGYYVEQVALTWMIPPGWYHLGATITTRCCANTLTAQVTYTWTTANNCP